jgi:hypothetical protein
MDTFSDIATTLSAPARDAAAIVPSDATNLAVLPRAVWVGQGGNISVVMPGGQTVTLQGIAAGTLLPLRPARVNATGTTAGAMVALW